MVAVGYLRTAAVSGRAVFASPRWRLMILNATETLR